MCYRAPGISLRPVSAWDSTCLTGAIRPRHARSQRKPASETHALVLTTPSWTGAGDDRLFTTRAKKIAEREEGKTNRTTSDRGCFASLTQQGLWADWSCGLLWLLLRYDYTPRRWLRWVTDVPCTLRRALRYTSTVSDGLARLLATR